jgi:hypothetical protein
MQFLGKLLAGLQAAVDIQQFHQVHNRGAPVQRLASLLRFRIQDGFHVDHLHRRTGKSSGEDIVQNAHWVLLEVQ